MVQNSTVRAIATARGLNQDPQESRGSTMRTPRASSVPNVPNSLTFSSTAPSSLKRSSSVIDLASEPPSTSASAPKASIKSHFEKQPKKLRQTKMWTLPSDPAATLEMDVAVADFVLSRGYDFALVNDEKFKTMIDVARRVPPNYKPPTVARVGGELLNKLYDVNWNNETDRLLKDARTFGISMFGDGATINTNPKINACASGVYNPFAMLDVFDCTQHMADGGIKDAPYIAGLFIPLIKQLENVTDPFVSPFLSALYCSCGIKFDTVLHLLFTLQGEKFLGIVDMVYFDGASNVQKAGRILEQRFPRITSGSAAEHTTSLFFDDIFSKIPEYMEAKVLCTKLRNVFGNTRHATAAMFKSYSKKHNRVSLGFIKPSDCR